MMRYLQLGGLPIIEEDEADDEIAELFPDRLQENEDSIGDRAMTEQDKRNIQTVHLMYSGDEAERANIAANIVWHVPGHNPVSGDYHGYDEYMNVMPARMAPLSQWDFELEDVLVNGTYVVATFYLQGERKGKKADLHGAHIMRLNDNGQIFEGWGFTNDQDVLDEFFSA